MASQHEYERVDDATLHDDVHSTAEDRESIELKRIHSPHDSLAPLADAPPTHSQVFNSTKQTWRIFYPQFVRWLGTVIIVIFMLATLKIYQGKGNFSRAQKHSFNTIITALSLALGLNFFEAFKDIAKVLRWKILAGRSHSIHEFDLILSIESLSKVVELAWASRRKILIVAICVSWLLLNLIAQAAVAVIGLTYSADSGTDWQGTYPQAGLVNASDLGCYSDNKSPCPSEIGIPEHEVEQIIAHSLGEMAQNSACRTYNDLSEVYESDANPLYWCNQNPGRQEFAYRFTEVNPVDTIRVYPRLTNRVITAASSRCYQYNIDTSSGVKVNDLNGDLAAYNWSYSNGTVNGSITIPTTYSAFDSTTYVYRGTNIPQLETQQACGSRCMWMWAYRARSTFPQDSGQEMAVFQCPITISEVSNTTNATQEISDGMAKLAAASIALQGRFVGLNQTTQVWTQYQLYPWGATWEIHNHKIDEVGANMASFALGSLASMAVRNPSIQVHGLVPILGYHLSIHWNYVVGLCACIVGVHFALFAAAVYTTRLVVIKDESNLSIARLLRPLVEHLGESGTLMDGEKMSAVIEEKLPNGIVYGPREEGGVGGERRLDVGEGLKSRRMWPDGRHPDGRYS